MTAVTGTVAWILPSGTPTSGWFARTRRRGVNVNEHKLNSAVPTVVVMGKMTVPWGKRAGLTHSCCTFEPLPSQRATRGDRLIHGSLESSLRVRSSFIGNKLQALWGEGEPGGGGEISRRGGWRTLGRGGWWTRCPRPSPRRRSSSTRG